VFRKSIDHTMKKNLLFVLALLFLAQVSSAQNQQTFTNPLLPSGADPYSFYKDGFYYYTNTLGDSLMLWKTRNLADLKNAEHKVIWVPPAKTAYSRELWAPEFHFIKGKWYAYFAADDGNNNHHRTYVLENASADPFQGEWVFKGKVATASADKWAIDSDVFEQKGKLYMVWAGWEGDVNGRQNIYIAKMKNPWTIKGKRTLISTPTYSWERNGDLNDANNPSHVDVNEGPQFLKHGNKIFVVYSASGCWTDFYALGMLTGKNHQGRCLSNLRKTVFMRPAIIRFLNHPMEQKTGFYITQTRSRGKAVAGSDRQGRKNLPGTKMARLILASR